MPLYDFKCLRCEKEFEEFTEVDKLPFCSCGGITRKIWKKFPNRDWFRPFVSEDFNGEPILVETKNHLKNLCKKHGVYSKALGYGWNLNEI